MFMKGTYAWNLRVSQTNEGYCHVQTSMHHLLFLHMGKIAEEHDFGGDANCVPASLSLNLILTFLRYSHLQTINLHISCLHSCDFPKIFILHFSFENSNLQSSIWYK